MLLWVGIGFVGLALLTPAAFVAMGLLRDRNQRRMGIK